MGEAGCVVLGRLLGLSERVAPNLQSVAGANTECSL